MRIRQSMLSSFDACPRRLQYDLEAPRDEYRSGIVRAVGTAYHAALEYWYLRQMEAPVWSLARLNVYEMALSALNDEIERAGERFIWDEKFPTQRDAEQQVTFMLERYFEDGHAWPEDWEVLGVEYKFEHGMWDENGCLYFDHVRTGTIDLVLRDPNGWIYGVDHKTAGRKWDQYKHLPRKNSQACFYVAALQELYPDAPGHRFVFDIMTYKGEFERRVSDPRPEHVKAVLDKALQVATVYEGCRSGGMDLPANPSSTLCSARYCDWWTVCPHGQALDV